MTLTSVLTKRWPVLLPILGLAALLVLNLQPYGGNVTSFFHLDTLVDENKPVPDGFVILQVPAYDGAHYYQIARSMPMFANPDRWPELRAQPTLSYAYQRFLLPLLAYVLSLGQEPLLPYIFLLINLVSIVLASWVVLRATKKPLYAWAIAFCPSAMVALHFSLAEPLTLLILALFLTRFAARGEKLHWTDVVLLSLLVLSREVNILFVGFLTVYLLFKRNFRDVLWMAIPIAVFVAFHGLIYAVFENMPFLTSADKRTFPFQAVLELLAGKQGYNHLTLTSIPLFLFFVLPGILWSGWLGCTKKDWSFLAIGTFVFLLLMGTMPDYIWGSITSIGRVITPVYPLTLLLAAKHDTPIARFIAFAALFIGLAGGVALALNHHPFVLS